MCVHNVSDSDFTLAHVKLAEKNGPREDGRRRASLEMRSLNATAEQVSGNAASATGLFSWPNTALHLSKQPKKNKRNLKSRFVEP